MKKNRKLLYFLLVIAVIILTIAYLVYGYSFANQPIYREVNLNTFLGMLETNQIQNVIFKDSVAMFSTKKNEFLSVVVPKMSSIIETLMQYKIPTTIDRTSIFVKGAMEFHLAWSKISVLFAGQILKIISSLVFIFPLLFSRSSMDDQENEDHKVISFQQVIGMRREKREVMEIINIINNVRELSIPCKSPKGIIFAGPPGNGKTFLAKAIAGELKGQFLYASAASFMEKYVGVGPARVRSLFKQAKDYDGFSVVFIDEADALGSRKNIGIDGGSSEKHNTINQLLTEMDGFNSNDKILVVLATNRIEDIDEALLRSGRVDREIFISLPNLWDRELQIDVLLRDYPVDYDINVPLLARNTSGFSRSDLTTFVNEAAIYAARFGSKIIKQEHLELAHDRMILGIEKDKNISTRKELYNTSYHEIGHAFVTCMFEKDLSPVYKVTILPRGRALGVTIREGVEKVSQTKREIEANVMVMLAGRACEVIFFGTDNVTSGCSSDLAQAKRLIETYIIYGMDENYGVSFMQDQYSRNSDREKNAISQHADLLLNHFNKKVFEIIQNNYDIVKKCAEELFVKETLTGYQLKKIIYNYPELPVCSQVGQSLNFL